MNISGGTKFVKYFASIDYVHEGDLFREFETGRGYDNGYGYNRINMRSNLDFNITKTTLFKVSVAGPAVRTSVLFIIVVLPVVQLLNRQVHGQVYTVHPLISFFHVTVMVRWGSIPLTSICTTPST